MMTRTSRRTLKATAASVAAAAALAAVVLAGPAALPARAGSVALAAPAITVARGTTSSQSSGWRFSELVASEFPVAGFSIIVEIRPYQGAAEGISFYQASAPIFSGPASLDGSAYFVGPRTLRIDIGSSSPTQLETFDVTGLRLTASETCGLGPVLVSYTNPGFIGSFGTLPSIASAGGATATPTPSPTTSASPSPSPSASPPTMAVTAATARVALGWPAAYASSFRSTLVATQGSRVTVRATVRPIAVGRHVSLYRRYGTTGSWRYVATVHADASGAAVVATRVTLPTGWTGSRQIQFRWLVPATATAAAAWSNVAKVIVH